jgi:hypothetical protein
MDVVRGEVGYRPQESLRNGPRMDLRMQAHVMLRGDQLRRARWRSDQVEQGLGDADHFLDPVRDALRGDA